jgi:hypothetical protein
LCKVNCTYKLHEFDKRRIFVKEELSEKDRFMGKRVFMLFLKSLNISAIAPISFSYIPSIAAIEPPEKPGIINAIPIAIPRSISIKKDLTLQDADLTFSILYPQTAFCG